MPGDHEVLEGSQFLRELHFIEAPMRLNQTNHPLPSQFLRELQFIEAIPPSPPRSRASRRSSFGNGNSLRPAKRGTGDVNAGVAVPSGAALH